MPTTSLPHATVNLALQGGGAHGAFTWGVLDALLEDGQLAVEGVSGTSAGAMNAICLAQGLMAGGRDGAREALAKFWTAVAESSPFPDSGNADGEPPAIPAALKLMLQWTEYLSPEQLTAARQINVILRGLGAEIRKGRDIAAAEQEATAALSALGFNKVDYCTVRDARTLRKPDAASKELRALVAAWIGQTRLIDNLPA